MLRLYSRASSRCRTGWRRFAGGGGCARGTSSLLRGSLYFLLGGRLLSRWLLFRAAYGGRFLCCSCLSRCSRLLCSGCSLLRCCLLLRSIWFGFLLLLLVRSNLLFRFRQLDGTRQACVRDFYQSHCCTWNCIFLPRHVPLGSVKRFLAAPRLIAADTCWSKWALAETLKFAKIYFLIA